MAAAVAAVTLLSLGSDASADDSGRSAFFNPFSFRTTTQGTGWFSVFGSPSASTGLRGSFAPPAVEVDEPTDAPEEVPAATPTSGRPNKPLPYRSPFRPPPRPPFS